VTITAGENDIGYLPALTLASAPPGHCELSLRFGAEPNTPIQKRLTSDSRSLAASLSTIVRKT
jgi:hypothetical protein